MIVAIFFSIFRTFCSFFDILVGKCWLIWDNLSILFFEFLILRVFLYNIKLTFLIHLIILIIIKILILLDIIIRFGFVYKFFVFLNYNILAWIINSHLVILILYFFNLIYWIILWYILKSIFWNQFLFHIFLLFFFQKYDFFKTFFTLFD